MPSYADARVLLSLDVLEDQLEVVMHTFHNNAPMVKSIVLGNGLLVID
ncbi:hypothetical protein NTGBS_440094 [Candidatus Nitrotoga sp. BS]|nr:hypothetical protein NTGBS_440094 [Candidatus Nitrotoga sp. BS]